MSVGKELGRRGITLTFALSVVACSGNRTVYPTDNEPSDAGDGGADVELGPDSAKSDHSASVSFRDGTSDNTESAVMNQPHFFDGGSDGGEPGGRPTRPTFLPEERPLPTAELVEPDPIDINVGDSVPPIAVRLGRFIWRTEPDATTVDLARKGELDDAESVYREALRLLADPRAERGFLSFFGAWADVARPHDDSPMQSPDDGGAAAVDGGAAFSVAARAELDAYFMNLVSSGAGLRDLVRQSFEVGEPALIDLFTGEPTIQRVGVFSQPFVLAAGAYPDRTSPSRRGAFVARRLLCQDFSATEHPAVGALAPGDTVRSWVEDQTKADDCAECHSVIDQLGFALDGFDQRGRARSSENDQPIDTTADLGSLGLPDANAPNTLGTSLLYHPNTLPCVLSHWFKYALQREPRVEDDPSWVELVRGSEFYELREVPALIAATQSFRAE